MEIVSFGQGMIVGAFIVYIVFMLYENIAQKRKERLARQATKVFLVIQKMDFSSLCYHHIVRANSDVEAIGLVRAMDEKHASMASNSRLDALEITASDSTVNYIGCTDI